MDDGPICVQTANASSSDSESIYDSTVTSDPVDDEEINSDESSEAMDTIPLDENIDEQGIEVPIEISVFSKRLYYHTYSQFDSTQVIASYCTCIPDPRTVDCCLHIAAAIWLLGYERYQSTTNRQPSSTNITNVQYADDISDFEPSSDDEHNSYIYTSK
ncbi:unnamed protein product [Rotaria socialis]|uniref:SWIM-type domain-containing protein n=1 Tax=Rotaria socialis TaxID=392032 RepID=A0A818CR46_9BILA|nr:unnamed protein product [Rotaria socialis]CAF4868751.1 unnamed protein product [Rotaria socialis]